MHSKSLHQCTLMACSIFIKNVVHRLVAFQSIPWCTVGRLIAVVVVVVIISARTTMYRTDFFKVVSWCEVLFFPFMLNVFLKISNMSDMFSELFGVMIVINEGKAKCLLMFPRTTAVMNDVQVLGGCKNNICIVLQLNGKFQCRYFDLKWFFFFF